jgi:hypothetical protein
MTTFARRATEDLHGTCLIGAHLARQTVASTPLSHSLANVLIDPAK